MSFLTTHWVKKVEKGDIKVNIGKIRNCTEKRTISPCAFKRPRRPFVQFFLSDSNTYCTLLDFLIKHLCDRAAVVFFVKKVYGERSWEIKRERAEKGNGMWRVVGEKKDKDSLIYESFSTSELVSRSPRFPDLTAKNIYTKKRGLTTQKKTRLHCIHFIGGQQHYSKGLPHFYLPFRAALVLKIMTRKNVRLE